MKLASKFFVLLGIVCMVPALAFSKPPKEKVDPYAALREKLKPSLVHILPTQEIDLKRLPMGCTGFFIGKDLVNPKYNADEAFILTNLSCLIGTAPLNAETPNMQFIGFKLVDYNKKEYTDFQISGFHPLANLAVIKIFRYRDEKDGIIPLPVNTTRPLDVSLPLYAVRSPSTVPANDILESKLEKQFSTSVQGMDMTYLLHQGLGQGNGFEGGPIVNKDGQVIGINTYSNFYFFNIGYDLAPMLESTATSTMPMISHMNWRGDARNMSYMMEADKDGFAMNEAFDEALYTQQAMQKMNFNDPLDLFFNPMLSKFKRLKAADAGSQLSLFHFHSMDYMMDYVFGYLMNDLLAIQNSRTMEDARRTKSMNDMDKDITNYFTRFSNLKSAIELLLEGENPYLKAYKDKMECTYEAYRRFYKSRVGVTGVSIAPDTSEMNEACSDYFKFMKKTAKPNFDALNLEPYPHDNVDGVLKNTQQYLPK